MLIRVEYLAEHFMTGVVGRPVIAPRRACPDEPSRRMMHPSAQEMARLWWVHKVKPDQGWMTYSRPPCDVLIKSSTPVCLTPSVRWFDAK